MKGVPLDGPHPEEFPRDLQGCIANTQWQLSVTTVGPAWEEAQFPPGHVGLILEPRGPASVVQSCPQDGGSNLQPDGQRVGKGPRPPDAAFIKGCVHTPDEYVEWVFTDYCVRGLFIRDIKHILAYGKLDIEKELVGMTPEEQQQVLAMSGGSYGEVVWFLSAVNAAFVDLDVFTVRDAQYQLVNRDGSLTPVGYEEIYPWVGG